MQSFVKILYVIYIFLLPGEIFSPKFSTTKTRSSSNIEIYLGLNPKFPKMFVSSLYIKNPPLSLAIFL